MPTRHWTDQRHVALVSTGLGLFFLLVGLALAFRRVANLVPWEPNFTIDFDYYILAGASLLRGENPYTAAIQMHAEHIAGGYVYPPLLAWVLAPLGVLLPVRLPYLVWVVGEMAGFAATLVLSLRAGSWPVRWNWVTLAVGAAFLPFMTWDNFYHGQVDFVLMAVVTVGLFLVARGRPTSGGFVLALAPSVKPFLAVLLLYLAWRNRWRAFVVMAISGAALLVLSLLPTLAQGTGVVEGWIEASRTQGMPPLIGHSFNHALYGTFVRLFTLTPYAVPWWESQALLLALTSAVGVVAAAAWLVAVPPGPLPERHAVPMIWLEAGLLLTLLFAVGPIAESNHLIVLWPAIFVAVRLALASPEPDQRQRWQPAALAWAVYLFFTAGPIRQLTWTEPLAGVPEGLMVLATGRVGVLLLLAGLVMARSVALERRALTRARAAAETAVGSTAASPGGTPISV